MNKNIKKSNGFSLLELLISIAIIGFLGAIGFVFMANYRGSVSLDSEANKLTSYLRQTQNRAMTGEDLSSWGIHFVNPSGEGGDYYAIFKGVSYSSTGTVETIYLSKNAKFNNPTDNTSKDVVFQRITGTTSSSTITIASKFRSDLTKDIIINPLGQISK